MAKTTDSAVQFIEAALFSFAQQIGATAGNTSVHRVAVHILDGLSSGYLDQVVEAAREHWDIDCSRAAKYDGDGSEAPDAD